MNPSSVTYTLIYFFSHPSLCFNGVEKGKDVKWESVAPWTATAKLHTQDHPCGYSNKAPEHSYDCSGVLWHTLPWKANLTAALLPLV